MTDCLGGSPRIRLLEAKYVQRILMVVFCCGLLYSQAVAPERNVDGNVLVSKHDPAVRVQVPKTAQYVGAIRWPLYEVADCELHAFVEADANKNVQRLYWVQFEGYLPEKPEMHYTYDSPRHTNMGGLDFYVDTWVRPDGAKTRPGSDRERIEALIRAKGYRMPAGMMYVRLVHLLEEQKRKELMIVYGEDLAPTGLSAAALDQGGNAHDRWPAIEKGLVDRAQQGLLLISTP
jgi:hypothetical protein